jgi:TrmH family RNA methyltransferase
VITSTKNPQVARAARLRKRGLREQRGRFLAEGAQSVEEALRAGAVETLFHVPGSGGRVSEVVARAAGSEVRAFEVSEAVIRHLTSSVTPQGLVAVTRYVDVPMEDVGDPALVPVLCAVRDPGNAGTILRSADAAGASAVVFSEASVDVYNAKTVRASAGSLFHVPVVRGVPAAHAVEALRARGAQVLAAAADGEISVYEADLGHPTALLLGNEAWGLPAEVRDLADGTVRVPIAGRAESLNLAAAAAVVLFEAARQRSARGGRAGGDMARLVSAAAHDVRLPLTALKGFAGTLVDHWDRFDDPARRELLEGILLDTERVTALVSMLVDAARMDEGRFSSIPEPVDLAEAAAWVAALFARTPDYPEVRPIGSASATTDPDRLRQVLLAICDAALWWGDGAIEVRVEQRDLGAAVVVRRAGDGPTEEERAALFRPGSRKVGLVLAHRVAGALGGALDSEPGPGVGLRLLLPPSPPTSPPRPGP